MEEVDESPHLSRFPTWPIRTLPIRRHLPKKWQGPRGLVTQLTWGYQVGPRGLPNLKKPPWHEVENAIES